MVSHNKRIQQNDYRLAGSAHDDKKDNNNNDDDDDDDDDDDETKWLSSIRSQSTSRWRPPGSIPGVGPVLFMEDMQIRCVCGSGHFGDH